MTRDISARISPEQEGYAQKAGARMRALHRATLSLSADLSLDGVLQRIVQAAKELTNARYAALGLLDHQGKIDTFITQGMSQEEIDRMPHKPLGKGLIGEMLRGGRSLRIPEIADHPQSAGFPAGHPIMHSFLGVGIAAYGRPLGQIYLTDKLDSPEFSEGDQQLIEMLAAHAAAAIENARLYQQIVASQAELAQRNEELEVSLALSDVVSSAMDLEGLLSVMLERISALFNADAGEIHLRDENQNVFRLVVHHGEAEDAFRQIECFKLGEGWVGSVAEQGKPLWSSDLERESRYCRQSVVQAGFGTQVSVPLRARGQVLGVLGLAFHGQRPINEREVGLLEAVGAGAGITIANARLARQARRLAVLEERERIAMDLHDGIIQSIYAVGLTLESTRLMSSDSDLKGLHPRLESAIEGLNAVIRDLRNYILDLQPSRMRADSLADALEQLAREFRANTPAKLELMLEPQALAKIPPKIAEELYLIAQEALANVAKHAQASKSWLNIRQVEGQVLLQVIDNGHGFDVEQEHQVLGHGLSNMIRRANAIGGACDLSSSPGDGTTLTVRLNADELASSNEPGQDPELIVAS